MEDLKIHILTKISYFKNLNIFKLQMGISNENQMACSPDSPVLIRIALSRFITKIFPSPIRPV